MNQSVNCKTVVAAAVLCAAANLAFAQDATPTVTVPASSNSEVNPNPLQTNPVEGQPSSANGKMTPGTGTGSSRTMRNEGGMTDQNSGTRSGTSNGTGSTMPADDMPRNRSTGSNGSTGAAGTTGVTESSNTTGSMNDSTTTPAPMSRPARRDRG